MNVAAGIGVFGLALNSTGSRSEIFRDERGECGIQRAEGSSQLANFLLNPL